jgi:hypothetical protein
MSERKRRIGENEAIFRSVNEEVRSLHGTLAAATETLRIVCECGARSCTDQFNIETVRFTEIREDPTLFVIRPGHDLPESETVVSREGDFWIVRKDPGLPAELARATAPDSN